MVALREVKGCPKFETDGHRACVVMGRVFSRYHAFQSPYGAANTSRLAATRGVAPVNVLVNHPSIHARR